MAELVTSRRPPRKGATRISEIPPGILGGLNEGRLETITLVEWLAIDVLTLARHALDDVGLVGPARAGILARAERLRVEGIVARTKGMGATIFETLRGHARRAAVLGAISRHPSDMVRAWAAAAEAADARLTLPQRLSRCRRYAADAAGSVRECAWDTIRAHVAADLPRGLTLLERWVRDPDPNVRRCAVEATRPRGVWTFHIDALKRDPEPGRALLEPVRADASRYVQRAVGNWINDASRTRPDWAKRIGARWLRESPTEETRWIVRHALRTVRRKEGER
jgi:3-methyladenine DNA glycosylase AlkC